VFFEDPFWVGVFERIENKKLSVAKVPFGAECKVQTLQIRGRFISIRDGMNRHFFYIYIG
jgi:hypothetical protein